MPRPDNTVIHVRFARAQPITADALACLDESERAQAACLPTEAAQDYICAHRLLRETLSEFADIAPSAWRFARTVHGKPFTKQAPLKFNLSHTRGMAALAVTSGREVGIDIEALDPHRADAIIARQMFATSEFELWQSAHDPVGAFFHIWTLKEAVMKAAGLGMVLPLQDFSVTLAPSQFVLTHIDELWKCEFGIFDQYFAWGLAVECETESDAMIIHQSKY